MVSSSRQLSKVAVSDWLAKLMGYSFCRSAPKTGDDITPSRAFIQL